MPDFKPIFVGLALGCAGCMASSALLAQSSDPYRNGISVPADRAQGMRERCNALTGADRDRCYTQLRSDELNRMGDRWPAAGISGSNMAHGLAAGERPEGARFGGG